MDLLSELAIKHSTDKSPKHHNYTPIYDKIMSTTRDQVTGVLEIGLQYGASARMWLDYFPKAIVYSVDNDIDSINNIEKSEFPGRDRWIGITKDQNDPEIWESIDPGSLDYVIDDGSHEPQDQIDTFINGFPYIKPGGYYIIEDCHCCFYPTFNPLMEPFIYEYIFKQIIDQQKIGVMTGNFYMERDNHKGELNWMTKHLYSFHFYKSLIIMERTYD